MTLAFINNSLIRQVAEMNSFIEAVTPPILRSMRAAEDALAAHRQAMASIAPVVEASRALQRVAPSFQLVSDLARTTLIENATATAQIIQAAPMVDVVLRDIRQIVTPAVVDTHGIVQHTAPMMARVSEDIRRMITPVTADLQALGTLFDSAFGWGRRFFPPVWIQRSPFDRALATAAWADEVDPFSPEVDSFLMQHCGDLINDRNDLTYARLCFTRILAPKVRNGALIPDYQVRQCLLRSVREGRHQVARQEGVVAVSFIGTNAFDDFADLESRLLVEQFLDTIPDLGKHQRAAMLDLLNGYRWSEALRLHCVTDAGRKKVQRTAQGLALFMGRPDLLQRKRNQGH